MIAVDATHFVYVLADPRTPGRVRYVGITGRPIRDRLNGHLAEARSVTSLRKHTYRINWLRGLMKDGLLPYMAIVDTASSREEAFEREQARIAEYRSTGHQLVNGTEGGRGTWANASTGPIHPTIANIYAMLFWLKLYVLEQDRSGGVDWRRVARPPLASQLAGLRDHIEATRLLAREIG